jgi:hypothetical protein
MALPTVTSLMFVSPVKEIVVHPDVSDRLQSKPVNPFVQIHEQEPWLMTLVPPFAQFSCVSHCCNAACASRSTLCLRITKNSTGMTTAAATRRMTTTSTTMKPHKGKPQHLRPLFPWPSDEAFEPELAAFASCDVLGVRLAPRGRGQDWICCRTLSRQLRLVGTAAACAGGGKAASISENPDLCFSPSTASELALAHLQIQRQPYKTWPCCRHHSPNRQTGWLASDPFPSLRQVWLRDESNQAGL